MASQFTHGYALLIGVDANAVAAWALPDVAKDIAALAQVLTQPGRCAYPKANVKVVQGQAATRRGILDGLQWLQARIRADTSGDATAIVYYSGHGWRDEAASHDFYLIPYDMKESRIKSYALPATAFAEAVGDLKPERLLVVLDCCHAAGMGVKDLSGPPAGYAGAALAPGVFMDAGKAIGGPGAKGLETLAEGHGRAVLSSSTGDQESYLRRDRKMSIFTYHLIEALTGHAQPQEGATEVLVSDVMSHVYRRVPQSVKADWGAGAAQEPDYQVSGNFPVALLLGGQGLSKGQPAPDPLGDVKPKAKAEAPPGPKIDTGGAAYHFEYEMSTGGDDFIDRDMAAPGHATHRDMISVRDVSDDTGVGVGGAKEIVSKGVERGASTGGGAYIEGGVSTDGGDFVGRDELVRGDKVHGDKIQGDKITVGDVEKLVIIQGSPAGNPAGDAAPLIEETIRLDVAAPPRAPLNEPFTMAIAVMQPDAPPLAVSDIPLVASGEGSIFRTEEDEVVKYRVEVTGAGFEVSPPHYILKLRPRQNSRPCLFQVTPHRPGKQSLFVNAYQQDDGALAAQTLIHIEVEVAVQPGIG